MDFKRKLLIAALPLAFCLSTTVHAEMTLKIAEIHPAGYPTVVAQENMGKKIEEATDGELKFRMFSGGVLGSEKEVVEQVQLGAVQMTRVSLGTLGPVVPDNLYTKEPVRNLEDLKGMKIRVMVTHCSSIR